MLIRFNIYFSATKNWTLTNGCIKGDLSHLKSNKNIESLDKCRQLCAENNECLSVDYNLSVGNCNFNSVTTETDEITSCNNYQYSEPIRCKLSYSSLFLFFYLVFLESRRD